MSSTGTQETTQATPQADALRGQWGRWLCGLLVLLAGVVMLVAMNRAPGVVGSEFDGVVVGVIDGDSLHIRRASGEVAEIRMAGIDAPEYSQPWGKQATIAMKMLVLGKPVQVAVTDKDRYGRLVAKVWQNGLYVNAEMARSGNAWAFDRYMKDTEIRAGQNAARKAGRGLWALPAPERVPPATWRARHPR